ncbi:MAG: Terminase-like family protein [Cyanobacteria bacterium J06629_18]
MKLTRNKIRNLEKRANKRYSKNPSLKPIPKAWEDFVRLCTIRSGGAMVRFDPYPYQLLLSRLMDEYNNIVIVKSRQLGVTQTAISKFIHRAAQNPAYSSMSFLRSQDDASAIARRSRQLLQGLEGYTQAENDSVGYLKLRDAGELYFKNSSKEGSRSYDSIIDFLFDEAGFAGNIAQIYAASSPSSALAGDAITKLIVSTPSSKSGWFWEQLNQNNADKNIEILCEQVAEGTLYREIPGVFWWVDDVGTCKLVLHWRCHPIYSQREDYLEYRMKQDGTDLETVEREYNLRFIDSSVSVFSSDLIRLNTIDTYSDKPNKHTEYYCGLDTSSLGSDYTVFTVFEFKNNKLSLVHLYRKRHQTSEYHLYQISQIINKFNPQTIGVETNGVGSIYLENLTRDFRDLDFQGIRTSQDSKIQMISRMVLCLEKNQLLFPSDSPIIEEMLSFQRTGKKLEAASGKHDDVIMSAAFAVAVSPFSIEKIGFKFDTLGEI